LGYPGLMTREASLAGKPELTRIIFLISFFQLHHSTLDLLEIEFYN